VDWDALKVDVAGVGGDDAAGCLRCLVPTKSRAACEHGYEIKPVELSRLVAIAESIKLQLTDDCSS